MPRTTERTVALSELNIRGLYTVTASTTVYPSDSGIIFIANGAGAIEFTLPSVADCAGKMFFFVNRVDKNMTVTGGDTGKMVLLHTAAANGVSYTQGSQKIGAACMVVGDGSYYYVFDISAGVATVGIVTG